MSSQRVLRYRVPDRETLDRLAAEPLPDGWTGGPLQWRFFREIHFDTPDGDLERRGVAVRLRVHPDGERRLLVDAPERENEDGALQRRRAEAAVPDHEPQRTFAGGSEPARLLRAVIEPARLGPQLELETERRYRHVRAGEQELSLLLDAVTVRSGDLATDFFNLEARLPDQPVPGLAEWLRALEREHRLGVVLAEPLARAREVLDRLEVERLEHAVRRSREVAVVVYRDGHIAMRREEDGRLRVPTGPGWGEQDCRRVLRAHLGRAAGRLRLLSAVPGVGHRPALQVWLAYGAPADPSEPGSLAELEWVALDRVLGLAGAAEVRDARTLTALHAVTRADLPAEVELAPATAEARERTHPLRKLRDRRDDRAPVAVSAPPAPAAGGAPSSATEPGRAEPSQGDRLDPALLLNMELGTLAFNERVLALAEDPEVPLLARVRFVSILGGNLDEFFMTRVAGYKQQLANGSTKRTQDGLAPEEQLDLIALRVRGILDRAYDYLGQRLLPELEQCGIGIHSWSELSDEDRTYLRDNYAASLEAVLTPLAADPSHPFPHVRNLRPALGVTLRLPDNQAEYFAAIELPGDLPRFVPLPGGRRFVPLEDVIRVALPELYSGLEIVDAHTFRVTRSANFSLDEELVDDVLLAVEEEVAKRPLGPVVRLEVDRAMPEPMRRLLLRELQFESRDRISLLSEEDVFAVDGLVDLYGLHEIADLPLEDLQYPDATASSPLDADRPVFEQLRERDVLVRFPEHDFEQTVERLLGEAAEDADVVALKITLYRTNQASRVVRLLRQARRRGKNVVALVELKASFDEQRNIEWARSLEAAGIHVVYGPPRLKVHAKVALVVRREGDQLRRYFYIGTGNLNAATSRTYTDLGLLSTDRALGGELNDVFDGLTGYSVQTEYQHLLVAPFNMRTRFLEMIRRETEHARAGRGGAMRIKINGLTDREVIAALYEASQAGVRVDLIVRGLCSLRPGVPGVSDNIRVVSVLGRYLEHARIYRFDNAGEPEYYLGSADWRPRNLVRRVEVATPVRDPDHRATLDRILDEGFHKPDAWELRSDGSYVRRGGEADA